MNTKWMVIQKGKTSTGVVRRGLESRSLLTLLWFEKLNYCNVTKKLFKTDIILLSFVNDVRRSFSPIFLNHLSYPEFVAVVAAIFFSQGYSL